MISVHSKDENEKQAQGLNAEPQVESKKPSEHEIWKAFNKGNTEVINMIYQQNVDLMYNYGRQILNDSELVKDCIQEVFFRLIKSQHNTTHITSARAYLLKSLKREILRKKEKNGKYNFKESFEEEKPFGITLSEEMKPIEVHFTDKKKSLLTAALNNLPKKQREAVLLYYYEGFTYEEISQIMEIKLVKSARKLIYKAIASIKSSMRNEHVDLMFPLLLIGLLEKFS